MAGTMRARARLLLAGLLALAAGALADVVHMTNGRSVQGLVVREVGGEVVVVDENGARVVLEAHRVERVERAPESELSVGLQRLRTALQILEVQQDPAAAWLELRAAMDAEPALLDTYGSIVRQVARAALELARRHARDGDHRLAMETAEGLAIPDFALVDAAFASEAPALRREVLEISARARARVGERLLDERAFQVAFDILAPAVSQYFLPPEDPDWAQLNFLLGRVLAEGGRARREAGALAEAHSLLDQASSHLDAARKAPGAPATLQTAAFQALSETDSARIELAAELQAAEQPVPQGTPFDLRASVLATMEPAEPTPAPEPVATPLPQNLATRVLGQDLGGRVTGWWNQGVDAVGGHQRAAQHARWAALFGLIYWAVPAIVLRVASARLDPQADRYRRRVRLWGIFALLGYIGATMGMFLRRKGVAAPGGGKKRKSCPHCGAFLEDYFAYATMDYAHCHNCGGDVEPVLTLEGFIDFLAAGLEKELAKDASTNVAVMAKRDSVQRLVRAILTLALRGRASDIHIEPGPSGVAVRQRVDGVMQDVAKLPKVLGPLVVSAIKVQASLDIAEKRKPQDGALRAIIDEIPLDVRVATAPSHGGESATLRLLDRRSIQIEPKQLGMARSTREIFNRAINEPHGLVLVSGPTGSGKTTTLYVALQMLNTGRRQILSIEDPIEFEIEGINQVQVNNTAGVTFASALRSMLRQDPDVIMVGEIRDKETADTAISAALTGHLVFSPIHTIDSASSITRLIDLGVNPRQLADAFSLVMAQRLIRLICPDCAKPAKPPTPAEIADLGIPADDLANYEWMTGKGCKTCRSTGYYGRTGLYEMLARNTHIRALMESGHVSTEELRKIGASAGMRTLREEALVLLRQKMTTVEEVLRVAR